MRVECFHVLVDVIRSCLGLLSTVLILLAFPPSSPAPLTGKLCLGRKERVGLAVYMCCQLFRVWREMAVQNILQQKQECRPRRFPGGERERALERSGWPCPGQLHLDSFSQPLMVNEWTACVSRSVCSKRWKMLGVSSGDDSPKQGHV